MYHQEITIPVNKDSRNFEQRRKDMFTKLENNVSTHGSRENTTVSTTRSGFNDDMWDLEIRDWVNKSKSSWDQDFARIKRGLYDLEPIEGFGDFSNTDTTHHSVTSFSQKITTSDGKTKTESTKSFHSTSGGDICPPIDRTNLNQKSIVSSDFDRTNFNQKSLTSTDFFKDAYEVSDDKQVHFKVRLDTSGFKPEDLKITAQGSEVSIMARKENISANEKSFKEFSKTITVPPSVDIKKFQCHQTADGILILEAPLKQQENVALTLKDGLGVRAIADTHSTFSNSLVKVTGQSGPVVIDDALYGKKIHLEIPVDKDYEPSDFRVYTELNQIHIKGRHETKTANSSSFKEFSRYYEVPETLDPMSVSFHLLDGTLVVEAPLLRSA